MQEKVSLQTFTKKYVFIAHFQTGLTSAILNFLLMTQFTGIHEKVTEILLHIGILKNYCFSPLVNNHNLYNITTSINHFTKQPSFEGFIFHTLLKGKYLPLPTPTTTLSVRFVKYTLPLAVISVYESNWSFLINSIFSGVFSPDESKATQVTLAEVNSTG